MAKTRKGTWRPFKITLKLIFEITCVLAWVAFVVGIALNDPPLRNIVFTFGMLVIITTTVRAMTRSLVR